MIRYVCGFMHDLDQKNVLLIQKNKPSWQKGLWNGIGGKIEKNENPDNAMIREFQEETGLNTSVGAYPHDYRSNLWQKIIILTNEVVGYRIHFYRCQSEIVDQAKSITEEKVQLIPLPIDQSKYPTIPNLKWIVPFLFDFDIEVPIYIDDFGER